MLHTHEETVCPLENRSHDPARCVERPPGRFSARSLDPCATRLLRRRKDRHDGMTPQVQINRRRRVRTAPSNAGAEPETSTTSLTSSRPPNAIGPPTTVPLESDAGGMQGARTNALTDVSFRVYPRRPAPLSCLQTQLPSPGETPLEERTRSTPTPRRIVGVLRSYRGFSCRDSNGLHEVAPTFVK